MLNSSRPIAWLYQFAMLFTFSGLLIACSSDDSSQGNGNNGSNGSNPDAVADGAETDGGVSEPEKENFAVSYRTVSELDDSAALGLYFSNRTSVRTGPGEEPSTDTPANIKVQGSNLSCDNGCWVGPNLAAVYFIDEASQEGAFAIKKISLNSQYQAEGQPQTVVSGIQGPTVRPNHVSYQKDDMAYYRTYSNMGTEKTIGTVLGGPGGTIQADWRVDAESGRAFVFQADDVGQTLTIKYRGSSSGKLKDVYTLDATNYQQIGGSIYGGAVPAAFSPDGEYAAILTNAPNNYRSCSGNNSCSGPGKECGTNGRCVAFEHTVRFFDLDQMSKLGGDCGGEGQCGPLHTCYAPTEGDYSNATCIPKRVPFGLGAPQLDTCEETTEDGELKYNESRAPLSFDDRGNLYLVAGRACQGEQNIEQTDILKFNVQQGDYDVVFGNQGRDFEPSRCYDSEAEQIDVSDCAVYIENARISPKYNEIIFTATSPEVTETRLAERNIDLWRILRNGEQKEWVGNQGEQNLAVQSFLVYPYTP